eukprot:GHVU01018670.1.p1 GENE.GHVU01018670.1~~GHVU01018670.1.p1  ORF type:complete len:312 (+),score=26.35 GHVU01018670.1:980-1915(+)
MMLEEYVYTRGSNGDVYAGVWDDGDFRGSAVKRFPNGDIYEGDWASSGETVHGVVRYGNGDIYSGECRDGYRTGYGIMRFANGDELEGDWRLKGMSMTCGVMRFDNGSTLRGERKCAQGALMKLQMTAESWTGYGRHMYNNGTVYDGEIVEGQQHGFGALRSASGTKYAGEWRNGTLTGYGTHSATNGEVYEGSWKSGFPDGSGVMTYVRKYVREELRTAPEAVATDARCACVRVCVRKRCFVQLVWVSRSVVRCARVDSSSCVSVGDKSVQFYPCRRGDDVTARYHSSFYPLSPAGWLFGGGRSLSLIQS